MVITIDGPAGAGKSSVAKTLAERLGFQFLDTGAMYRAVTWAALEAKIDLLDQQSLAEVATKIDIQFDGDQVRVNGNDVTKLIREADVTRHVSDVADNEAVRQQLVMLQRSVTAEGDFVCEGRDQGTVVFPDAECKIFLTATASNRAQRRLEQIQESGEVVDFESILREQEERDQRDLVRPVGRLIQAVDAIAVDSDDKSMTEVVDILESIARQKIHSAACE